MCRISMFDNSSRKMIWNFYLKRYLWYIWSSHILSVLILHRLVIVGSNESGDCLQIFQCPDLTSDLLNLTAPDFAAKYHLKCSRHSSGHQAVCCPMQNPSLNTINQDEYLERQQSPFTTTKTLTYTEFSIIPQVTQTKTLTHTSTKTVRNASTKIQIKLTTVTSIKENTKTKTEKEYETITSTLTTTATFLSTNTIRVIDIQYDTKETTATETIYITDTFTESVPVTQIYVRTSKLRASTMTVTLPPVTTTVLIRSTVKRRPITRYQDSPFSPVMHRSALTSTIVSDVSHPGSRSKKYSQQQQNYIPDGFIELFGRVVLLPQTGDPLMNWTESVVHCRSFNSKPFVPKSTGDWIWLQDIAKTLDDTLWMPANDLDNEGSIIWTDNTVASQSWVSWWQSGGGNREADDCMLMWNTDGKVEMVPCSYTEYSLVCQF